MSRCARFWRARALARWAMARCSCYPWRACIAFARANATRQRSRHRSQRGERRFDRGRGSDLVIGPERRQEDAELAADAQVALDGDRAARLLDDPVHGGQAEARAASHLLRGEEGIEDATHG